MIKLLSIHAGEHDTNFTYYDGENISYFKTERKTQKKHHSVKTTPGIWEQVIYQQWGIKTKDLTEIVVVVDEWFQNLPESEEFFPTIEDYNFFSAECKVTRIHHHYAHALSYWPITNKRPDVNIVIDGFGEEDNTWSIFKDEQMVEKGSLKTNGSIGIAMGHMGIQLGIPALLVVDVAGKLMGLQSYGEADLGYRKELEKYDMYSIKPIFDYGNWEKYVNDKTLAKLSLINWAATVHDYIPDILIKHFKKYANKNDVIFYSGGVAQNVIWNTILKEEFPNLIIPPHCGDEGISIGGIEWLRRKYNLPEFTIDNFPYSQKDESPVDSPSDDTIIKTAQSLAEGKIVAWYQGNGEIGPRALGNRSILFNPLIKEAKDIINSIKNRENYRPFGASVLLEHKDDWFEGLPENPYMLYVGNVKKELPGITHVDGTCRAQTVDNSNPAFKKLLEEFYKITGCPVLLNTSLNEAGKPIAGWVHNCRAVFEESFIDIAVVGNDIIDK